MRKTCGSTLVASFALAIGITAGGLEPAAAQVAGDPAEGEQLFYDHGCYGCHGFNGETGARDLVATGSPIIDEFAAFSRYLRGRADRAPVLPSTGMPSYPESALSDSAVVDIYAYVTTFQLDAPNAEDIPALRAILESARRPYGR